MNRKLKSILGASAIILASIGISAIPTHADGLPDPGFEVMVAMGVNAAATKTVVRNINTANKG